MRHGRRAISPEIVGLMCDVLELSGDEAREWLAISIIENPKNSSRAEVLRKAFFALWVAGVVLGAVLPTESKAALQQGASAIVRDADWTPRTFWQLIAWLRGWLDRCADWVRECATACASRTALEPAYQARPLRGVCPL